MLHARGTRLHTTAVDIMLLYIQSHKAQIIQYYYIITVDCCMIEPVAI